MVPLRRWGRGTASYGGVIKTVLKLVAQLRLDNVELVVDIRRTHMAFGVHECVAALECMEILGYLA